MPIGLCVSTCYQEGRGTADLKVLAFHIVADIHKTVPPLQVAVVGALDDNVWQDAVIDRCWPALPRPPARWPMQVVMVQVLDIPAHSRKGGGMLCRRSQDLYVYSLRLK